MQLMSDRDGRLDGPLASIYAYHYAADTECSPEMGALPPGCGSEWSKTDRRLRVYRGRSAPAVYYCDDGWRFAWGVDAGAVVARLGGCGHLLRELQPGFEIQVTALGAGMPVPTESGVAPRPLAHHSLRMLALVTDAYGGHGGIARYNRDFFEALAVNDTIREIQILPRHAEITNRHSGDRQDGGSAARGTDAGAAGSRNPAVKQLRPTFSKPLYSLRALFLTLQFRPNVLFCGHLYMTPLAAALSSLLRIPLWVQVHGVEVFEKRGLLIRWALRRARLVTAVSRYTRAKLLEWAGIPVERVRVLPNTLDGRFKPGDREELKRRHGYAGIKVLLTVSRLDARQRHKGHDCVLEAIPLLLKRHPNTIYLIAGDGSDRARLESVVTTRGMTAHVKFMGRVSDNQLLELYQMTDVFVMPSTAEGFGIVFLEAAACGCAVVGGNRDGSVDALGEGAIGAAVNPDDTAALVTALQAALERPAPDAKRVSRFRRDNFERHLHDLLSSILAHRQRSR